MSTSNTTVTSSQYMAATTDNWSQINPVLLYGGIALAVVVVVVAVAAYAMKRAKISLRPAIEVKRIRSRSRSNISLKSRSRSMPKNDAEEKLVNEEGEVV